MYSRISFIETDGFVKKFQYDFNIKDFILDSKFVKIS